jgi:hypothetical protein
MRFLLRVGAPPAFASCSGLTFSALNFLADAVIFSIVSSKSGFGLFENRIGLIRATTNARRYGLSKPRLLSAFIASPTASSSSITASARFSRIESAFVSGSSRNRSMRFSTGWYAPPAKRPLRS